MKIRYYLFLIFFVLFFAYSLPISGGEREAGPIPVSPGIYGNTVTIDQRCPTFSWTSVDWAERYRIVVFKAESNVVYTYDEIAALQTPILVKRIGGKAFSWTPSSAKGLAPGNNYIWYVLAIDQYETKVCSLGRMFCVEPPDITSGIEEELRTKLKEEGLSDESMNNVFAGVSSDRNGLKNLNRSNENPGGIKGTEGALNTFYGTNAGNETMAGQDNSFFGAGAGHSNTTGSYNTFLGYMAGNNNAIGAGNTFSGHLAGFSNTTGYHNTFLGHYAGLYSTTGYRNTFLGRGAGVTNITGIDNTFLGYRAGGASTGSSNVFLGYLAGYYETGSSKLYIDNSDTSSPLIYGEFDNNIVRVHGNLQTETTGTPAVFQANRTDGATLKLAAGVANVQIGSISNHGVKFTTNNTWKMRLNAGGTLDMADGGSYNGTWNDASSIEFKENIRELSSDEAANALEEMNPVIYNYKKYKDEERVGFIAEHVPDIVANNDRKNLSAMDIVAVLTKVVKEQQIKIINQDKINSELLKRIEKLEKNK